MIETRPTEVQREDATAAQGVSKDADGASCRTQFFILRRSRLLFSTDAAHFSSFDPAATTLFGPVCVDDILSHILFNLDFSQINDTRFRSYSSTPLKGRGRKHHHPREECSTTSEKEGTKTAPPQKEEEGERQRHSRGRGEGESSTERRRSHPREEGNGSNTPMEE